MNLSNSHGLSNLYSRVRNKKQYTSTANMAKYLKYLTVMALAGSCYSVKAIDFANVPLYLLNASIPNVVLMLDDSGSTNWEITSPRHFDACAYQSRGNIKLDIAGGQLDETDIDNDGITDDVVCFYDNENYNGTKHCYDETVNTYIGGVRNDRWSSVRVRPGYGVRVFEDADFHGYGDSVDIANDMTSMPSGFNNAVSAFEIYRTDENLSASCGGETTTGLLRPVGTYTFTYLYSGYFLEIHKPQDRSYFTREFGDWRVFSSDFNVTYFDPDKSYSPWTSNLANATFTAAREHGVSGRSGYNSTIDLTGSFYVVAGDTNGFADLPGSPSRNPNHFATGANGLIDIWDSYTLYQINGSSVAQWEVSYEVIDDELGNNIVKRENRLADITDLNRVSAIQQNFANWYQYHRKRFFVMTHAVSELINTSPNYRYSYGIINSTTLRKNAPTDNSDLSTHNDNLLADLFSITPLGGTPLRGGLNTVGSYLKTVGSDAPITEACQQNFTMLFTDGYWGSENTNPDIGNEDGDPYSVTVADIAHYYYAQDLRSDLEDRVPSSLIDPAVHQHLVIFPIAFGIKGSLQDYDNDGWPDVMVDRDNDGAFDDFEPLTESDDWGDPFSSNESKIDDLWHAAFNSKGIFSSARTPNELVAGLVSALSEVDKRVGSASSIVTSTGSLRSNSLAYQARFNSATWTGDLIALPFQGDGNILSTPRWEAAPLLDNRDADNRTIITSDWVSGSLKGVPFRHINGSRLSSSYQSRLRTGMSSLGILGDASDYVEVLVDYLRGDSSNEGGGVQTDWTACAQENQTCSLPGTTSVRYGKDGVYNTQVLSGSVSCSSGTFGDPVPGESKSCEYAVTQKYGFRSRASKLGDLIHSNPIYVGPPSGSGQGSRYTNFANMWSSRQDMVYVGGNDGMLHGFNADTGRERIAYVPYHLADSIYQLADPGYTHKFFVDGQLSVSDVCVGSPPCTWKSMLTGSLRTGGKAVYALDVTNPAGFSEASAEDIFLWEFSSDDDADMGFSFGQPLVVKLSTGKWAVIISNGYNSDNGKAVLYILDAETGQPLATGGKLDTRVGSVSSPNGLSSPTAVDVDRDGAVDLVYAGDLQGNLWKFDISSTRLSDWGVAYSSGSTPIPLFAGGSDRPITAAPVVGRHPVQSGYMVYFGTGKYVESIDSGTSGQPTQGFFGIWDDGRPDAEFSTSIVSSNLLQQSILLEAELFPQDTNGDGVRDASDSGMVFRLTSNNRVCWLNCPGNADPHRGWQFDFVYKGNNRGEKQVTTPVLRNGRIIFTTLQPSADVCDRGGRSWLMELNAADGSYLYEPPFDLNGDGEFNASDADYGAWGLIDFSTYCPSGQCQSISGIVIDEIVQTPTILNCSGGIECKYVAGGDGGIDKLDENPGTNSLGRQSWRELRSD